MSLKNHVLNSEDRMLLINALTIAIEQFRKDTSEMDKAAAFIGGGGVLPVFAPGRHGQIAAERLAEQFRRQVAAAEVLIENLEGAVDVIFTEEE